MRGAGALPLVLHENDRARLRAVAHEDVHQPRPPSELEDEAELLTARDTCILETSKPTLELLDSRARGHVLKEVLPDDPLPIETGPFRLRKVVLHHSAVVVEMEEAEGKAIRVLRVQAVELVHPGQPRPRYTRPTDSVGEDGRVQVSVHVLPTPGTVHAVIHDRGPPGFPLGLRPRKSLSGNILHHPDALSTASCAPP
jgi:hypothetical protein